MSFYMSGVIYQTLGRMFHQDFRTPRSELKKGSAAEFFFNNFNVFGYLMKRTFECLILRLKLNINYRENKGINR